VGGLKKISINGGNTKYFKEGRNGVLSKKKPFFSGKKLEKVFYTPVGGGPHFPVTPIY